MVEDGKMEALDPQLLTDATCQAFKACVTELRAAQPHQDFYVFALWTDDSLQFVHPMANSEQALDAQVASYQQQVDAKYGISSSHDSLRWSYGDWGFVNCDEKGHFDELNRLLGEYFDYMVDQNVDDLDDDAYEAYEDACEQETIDGMNALARSLRYLDQQGFFGEGEARDKITLMLVGDLSDTLINASVKALNPPVVLERYRQQQARARQLLEERHRSMTAASIPEDDESGDD